MPARPYRERNEDQRSFIGRRRDNPPELVEVHVQNSGGSSVPLFSPGRPSGHFAGQPHTGQAQAAGRRDTVNLNRVHCSGFCGPPHFSRDKADGSRVHARSAPESSREFRQGPVRGCPQTAVWTTLGQPLTQLIRAQSRRTPRLSRAAILSGQGMTVSIFEDPKSTVSAKSRKWPT